MSFERAAAGFAPELDAHAGTDQRSGDASPAAAASQPRDHAGEPWGCVDFPWFVDRSAAEPAISFGRFRLLPLRRELFADGVPVRLTARAFDTLLALVEAQGELVTKDDLLARVWAGTVVEENNLQVQVSTLRKAFGVDRDLIRTVARRGYRFTGLIRTHLSGADGRPVSLAGASATRPSTNLPEPVSELIGRDVDLHRIRELVTTHRLSTLIGEGGIGKTRLGVEVARQLAPGFADGAWVVDLAALSDAACVPHVVATACGIEVPAGALSPQRVAQAIRQRQLLLVLDNCEHVVEAAAGMAEALLHSEPAVRVIVTSREPLRAEGECLYRVPPLELPEEGTENAEDLLRSGAVRLFVARARAADRRFALGGPGARSVGTICRRLGGIPLAIELAAARAGALGVEAVAARLDDRFRVLTSGRRTGPARHQSLLATLDWSYALLPDRERIVLRRLAGFEGNFSLDAASAVATAGEIAPSDVVDCLANLVAKSLVAIEVSDATGGYRLSETTRVYALGKLAGSGELQAVVRRRDEYFGQLVKPLQRCATQKLLAAIPDG